MGKDNLFDNIRHLIGGISWKMFLWSTKMTQEQYFDSIYLQEIASMKEGSNNGKD